MAVTHQLETMPVAQPPIDPADLLTPQELAGRLKVKLSWVHEQSRKRSKIRNKSPLPCIRMGKYLRFSWVQVSAWLVENKD
jgi:hypothetical protein